MPSYSFQVPAVPYSSPLHSLKARQVMVCLRGGKLAASRLLPSSHRREKVNTTQRLRRAPPEQHTRSLIHARIRASENNPSNAPIEPCFLVVTVELNEERRSIRMLGGIPGYAQFTPRKTAFQNNSGRAGVRDSCYGTTRTATGIYETIK